MWDAIRQVRKAVRPRRPRVKRRSRMDEEIRDVRTDGRSWGASSGSSATRTKIRWTRLPGDLVIGPIRWTRLPGDLVIGPKRRCGEVKARLTSLTDWNVIRPYR
jgi:hypothetical protein